MKCEEYRRLASTVDPEEQTHATLGAMTRHVMECGPCSQWLEETSRRAISSIDRETHRRLVRLGLKVAADPEA